MSCPGCFAGHEHYGTPAGTVETVHGVPTYVARPPEGAEPRGIIIVVPDAFGWGFVNNRLLADSFANNGGHLVYLPDFMNGWSLQPSMLPVMKDIIERKGITSWPWKIYAAIRMMCLAIPWLISNRPSRSFPRVESFLKSVNEAAPPATPVFAAGYCWGGKHVFTLARREPALCTALYTAHPSLIAVPADVTSVRLPISVAWGAKDRAMSMDRVGEMKRLLEAKADLDSEVIVYDEADHGFGVRADLGNPHSARHAAEAEKQCLDWFARFLPK